MKPRPGKNKTAMPAHSRPALCRHRFLVLFALLAVGVAGAFAAPRGEQNLDFDWRFIQQDVAGAEQPDFADAQWRLLDVPHDWSIEGTYSPNHPGTDALVSYLPTGIGCYRKVIAAPADWAGRRVEIQFDGVFRNCTVWLNGQKVGGDLYGFRSFWIDLTPQLKTGRNVLAVRVDNTLQPAARWYTGSGIYGHVNLTVSDPVHVAHWGVFVRTPEVSAENATVAVATEVRNDTAAPAVVKVVSLVRDPAGVQVAQAESEITVPPHATQSVEQKTSVSNPRRWSLETPQRYTLVTQLFREGKLADETTTPFGIRSIRWDADRGFILNDEPVKLKGMSQHHDGGPVGAAQPDGLVERRLRMVKDMGATAVRTAHNPRPPVFYETCDRLGLLVMDEIFDGWKTKAGQDYGALYFTNHWQTDVTEWIRRDRNHPSVILWSIGNETGHADEFGITPFIRALDATRPVAGGDVVEGVDVAGFNGRTGGKRGVMEKFHTNNPTTPVFLSEEPHSFQTRGFYKTRKESAVEQYVDPEYGDTEIFPGGHSAYRSSYDNCNRRMSVRASWKRTSTWPWCAGEFRWTDFDYLGEATWAGTESLAREFNFGVIDLAGLPKDHYYLYHSLWTEKPMVHLLPHWTHPGLEGRNIPVVAYANADEVELFQDGKSLGRQPRSELFDVVWQVPYRAGELRAVAYRAGKSVAETRQRTADAPQRIALTTDNAALQPDRRDLSLVTFSVTDKNGVVVPNADDRIDFAVAGPVKLLGYENGDPVDVTPHREPWRKVFAGLGRGFFQATGESGDIEVTAAGILGSRYFAAQMEVAVDVQRITLRGSLPAAALEIRFTTDGSEPTLRSPRFSGPFPIQQTTMVRAAVFREGKPVIATTALFTKGLRPVFVQPASPREDMGAAEDPTQKKAGKKGKKGKQ